MGQLIAVSRRPGFRPGVAVFELNRSLSGMGHERYRVGDQIDGNRPVDELARRLFAEGGIDGVHIYSNVVTVDLAKGFTGEGIDQVIMDLFTYYREGVEVVDPMAVAEPAPAEPAPAPEPVS